MNWPIITLPGTALDERRAINRIAIAVSSVRHKMEKEHSREWLETELRKGLREGRWTLTLKAVVAAYAGDVLADAALREIGGELQLPMLQGRELAPAHLQIIAYFQSAGQRAPHRRKRGRHAWYDNWIRNFMLCVLIEIACREYLVHPTRNRAARRANRNPSGISIVVAAFARNKIHLDEGSVQENIWLGLPGELARAVVAARPPESWFATIVP
jgi:hypothetical protein